MDGRGGKRRFDRCLYCGRCLEVCPAGTLAAGTHGYRVLLAGKLGRHPRLARELSGVFSEDTVLTIVEDCLSFYRSHSNGGDRFAEIFTNGDCTDIRISGGWTCIYRN